VLDLQQSADVYHRNASATSDEQVHRQITLCSIRHNYMNWLLAASIRGDVINPAVSGGDAFEVSRILL